MNTVTISLSEYEEMKSYSEKVKVFLEEVKTTENILLIKYSNKGIPEVISGDNKIEASLREKLEGMIVFNDSLRDFNEHLERSLHRTKSIIKKNNVEKNKLKKWWCF